MGLLLAVLGFAAVAQMRLTRDDSDYSGQRREVLIELLDSLFSAAERTLGQVDELERTRDELLSSSERRQIAIDEAESRLQVLEVLTGTVAATGPGVTITITDPEDSVAAASLLNGIEELRDAGAEAIEINDTVRVVASTFFTEQDGEVLIDGVAVRPPYLIDAIGSSHTLSEAVIFPGGLADEIERLGGTVSVEEANLVEVGSLHSIDTPEYSQPTEG
ncbi:MAG: DUF881 domain-containing protein [Nocardioidaceae bacterium]|nr:DUF881 domain-containing protein [Nocardioidaceae bacterium]